MKRYDNLFKVGDRVVYSGDIYTVLSHDFDEFVGCYLYLIAGKDGVGVLAHETMVKSKQELFVVDKPDRKCNCEMVALMRYGCRCGGR